MESGAGKAESRKGPLVSGGGHAVAKTKIVAVHGMKNIEPQRKTTKETKATKPWGF